MIMVTSLSEEFKATARLRSQRKPSAGDRPGASTGSLVEF
jgi:hypothetical protein